MHDLARRDAGGGLGGQDRSLLRADRHRAGGDSDRRLPCTEIDATPYDGLREVPCGSLGVEAVREIQALRVRRSLHRVGSPTNIVRPILCTAG